MAEETINVKLVTPTRKLYEATATAVVAPGQEGQFGVMAGHDPWFVALGMGPLVINKPGGGEEHFFLNRGFCQIDENQVIILAEVGEFAHEIDVERAQAARKRAEDRLKIAFRDETIDQLRAEAALRRALYRLDLAEIVKTKGFHPPK